MRGHENKQIADSLTITTGTVKVTHAHFRKDRVKDRFELAMYGRKLRGVGDELEDEIMPVAANFLDEE